MENVLFKDLLITFFASSSLLLASCHEGSFDSFPEDFLLVEDPSVIKAIRDFEFEYDSQRPGSGMLYYTLLSGKILTNEGRGPDAAVSESKAYCTYLVEYKANPTDYYFAYVKEERLAALKEGYDAYRASFSKDSDSFHFIGDEGDIDGKYIISAQKIGEEDILVYQGSETSKAPFAPSGYRLAFCAKKKEMTILENVSEGAAINKNMNLYKRVLLRHDDSSNKMVPLEFEGYPREYQNSLISDSLFSYEGKRLETYKKSYENLENCYAPILGSNGKHPGDMVRAVFDGDDVLLPRYEYYGSEGKYVDLLDGEEEIPAFMEDIYRDLKGDVLSSYLRMEKEEYAEDDKSLRYGVFDFEKVSNVIKTAWEA